jgi:hypothetical protein
MHLDRGEMHGHFIFAGASVPHGHRALAAAHEVIPQVGLVMPFAPIMRELDAPLLIH